MHVLADIQCTLADAAHHLGNDVFKLHGHDPFLGQAVHFFGDFGDVVGMLARFASALVTPRPVRSAWRGTVPRCSCPVSYTHLTLPTSDLV